MFVCSYALRKMSDFIRSKRVPALSINLSDGLFLTLLLRAAVYSWQLIKSYGKSNYRSTEFSKWKVINEPFYSYSVDDYVQMERCFSDVEEIIRTEFIYKFNIDYIFKKNLKQLNSR